MNRLLPTPQLLVLSLCIAAGAVGAEDVRPDPSAAAPRRWEIPAYDCRDALPKLAAAPVLDGNLAEWAAAAAVPVRFAAWIAHCDSRHAWNGPADCGMDVFCAWHEAGLCVAGSVTDDDVRNDRSGDALYEQDCVEVFADGRTGDAFMKPPYGPGAYHLFIRPPLNGTDLVAVVRSDLGSIEDLKAAGRRNAGGWTFELLIPWSAFPGVEPRAGGRLGLQFGLDDYDARDQDLPQPLMMTGRGATRLSRSPNRMTCWTLLSAGAEAPDPQRDLALALAAPGQIGEKTPLLPEQAASPGGGADPNQIVNTPAMEATLKLLRPDPPASAQAVFAVRDWTGKEVARQQVALEPDAEGDRKSWSARFRWNLNDAPDGVYRLEACLLNPAAKAGGQPVMRTERSLLVISGFLANGKRVIADAIARIEKADLPRLAQEDPLRAAAWMGAAACVEKLKRAQELLDYPKSHDSAGELTARLALLETGALPAEVQPHHRLLELAAQPDSQLTVEYTYEVPAVVEKDGRRIVITFRQGMIPIAVAIISEFTNAAAAKANFEAQHTGADLSCSPRRTLPGLKDLSGETELAGLRCRASSRRYEHAPMLLEQADPSRAVVLYSATNGAALILDADQLDCVQAEAAALAEPLPESIRPAIQAWLKRSGTPVLPFEQATGKVWCVLAGGFGLPAITNTVRSCMSVSAQDAGFALTALSGNRLIRVPGASKDAAVQVLEMAAAGKAISAQQADRLRRAVAAALPRQAPAPAADTNLDLYCGDVHAHTFYSDGKASPIGLVLQALHVGMGFLVITDHNTVESARLAVRLASEHGLRFPVIVGEEITTAWAHINAYPLKEEISPKLTPYETVEAARRQGAAITWNHPEWKFPRMGEGWQRQILAEGWRSTGLDAWEHPTMPDYRARKTAGTLPPMVGASDTHFETFDLFDSERTLIWAPSAGGDDLAGAVRRGKVLLVAPGKPELFYGSEPMCARALAALAEGNALTNRAAAVLREALGQADIPALLRQSPPRIVEAGTADAK